MGNLFSNPFSTLFANNNQARVVMVGLDAAGKTSVLYKLDENVVTIPTIGFNVENIKFNNVEFCVFDIGGQDKIRPLWNYYYDNTDAVIFVVDSADTERVAEAKDELHKTLQDPRLQEAKVLVLSNKQDLPNALSTTQLVEKLQMRTLKQNKWFVQPCCATNGSGIFEGMEWLSSNL